KHTRKHRQTHTHTQTRTHTRLYTHARAHTHAHTPHVKTKAATLACLLHYVIISSSLFVQDFLLHSTDELTLQGWMLYDKSLYLVSTTKKGWRASREDCQKRKADLVVINSREEEAFVSRLMDTSWIGLSDRETEGTLKLCSDGWSEEPCDRLHHWICEKVVDLDHLEAERNKEGP
uniref:C-type lectin domain-containing protein n=1 Tax=Gadus morhua TaxID=8049 RepID=A0A8C5CLA5_GADMO